MKIGRTNPVRASVCKALKSYSLQRAHGFSKASLASSCELTGTGPSDLLRMGRLGHTAWQSVLKAWRNVVLKLLDKLEKVNAWSKRHAMHMPGRHSTTRMLGEAGVPPET